MDTKDDLEILTALLDDEGFVREEQEQEDANLEGAFDEDEEGSLSEEQEQEKDVEGQEQQDDDLEGVLDEDEDEERNLSEEQEQEDDILEGLFDEDNEDEDGAMSEEPEQEYNNLEGLRDEDEDRGVSKEQEQQDDDLEGLFDEDSNDEEYKESVEGGVLATEDVVTELFGDVDDIKNEEKDAEEKVDHGGENLDKSKEELQEVLQRMQEQMKKLQEQLDAKQKVLASTSTKAGDLKPEAPTATLALPLLSKQAASLKSKSQAAVSSTSAAATGRSSKLQESSDFSSQLNNADSFKRKQRVAHCSKVASSFEDRGPLVEIKIGSSFQPLDSKATGPVRSHSGPLSSPAVSAGRPKPASLPPPPKDVAVEKYSGLRLRKPRVSSIEMDLKMGNRRLIRLSQVPECLTRDKLEDSDWVTFGVLVDKATPQSSRSGKTFSIWKLNDLHNLDVFVSLLLFGEVHKEHWKMEPGTVIGLLNPNPMKQKDGYKGVSLTVDHPQKVLVLGEAQDYGTCKGMKKNGDPCSQIVNLYECQYCQYHVKAQYKKMSSKRAELQSSFSGKAPNTLKGKGGSLRQRLCQDGFYYGGVSSSACAAGLTASKPGKPQQKTLDQLFVSGSAQLVRRAKQIAMQSGEVSGCSSEFKSLMSMPTPGALQLKQHLTQSSQPGSKSPAGAPLQSISASELLKQQKQKQRELREIQRRRANERLQQQSSATSVSPQTRGGLMSPLAAPEVPSETQTLASPPTPTLGRGFSVGDDILFFDGCPPPAASSSLSAAKLAALKKLRTKGAALEKEDPNALKRKRSNSSEISSRVEKNRSSPKEKPIHEEEEPALKKKRDQLRYIQSEEFQKILNAKSRHAIVLQAAEYQLQERYFDALVKKEQMEEKMKGIKEMKCRAVTCKKILQVNLVMSILLYVMLLVYLYGIQATNMDSSRQEQQQSSPDPVNSLITQLLQADLTRGKPRVNQNQQEKSRETDLRDTLPHLQDESFPSEEHVDVETLESDEQLVMLLNSELLRKHRRYSSSRVLLSEHPPLHPPPLYPSDDFVSGIMDRSPASNKTRKKRQAQHKSYNAEFSVCDSKSEWVWNKTKAVNMSGENVTVLRTFTSTKGQVFSQYFYETYCNPSRHRGCRGIDNKNWNSQCKTTQTFVRAFTQTDNKPTWTWIRINTSCVCALSKKRRRT